MVIGLAFRSRRRHQPMLAYIYQSLSGSRNWIYLACKFFHPPWCTNEYLPILYIPGVL